MEWRPRDCLHGVFSKPTEHVLYVHNRVVDELADGDRKPSERHGVDCQSELLEHDDGDQDRDGYRSQRDGRRAPVEQEREQNDRDDDHCLEKHLLHVID